MTLLELELLTACKAVVSDWNNRPQAFSKKDPVSLILCRNAIAKAESKQVRRVA